MFFPTAMAQAASPVLHMPRFPPCSAPPPRSRARSSPSYPRTVSPEMGDIEREPSKRKVPRLEGFGKLLDGAARTEAPGDEDGAGGGKPSLPRLDPQGACPRENSASVDLATLLACGVVECQIVIVVLGSLALLRLQR
jgi:hypothetical protein